MKLKIAVCYKGLLRTIKDTFSNHKKFLFNDNYIDVFCHTWNDGNADAYYFVKNINECKYIFKEKFKNFSNHLYDSILPQDNILNIKHDNDKKYIEPYNNINLHATPYNILSHLYSLHQSYFLCQLYSQNNNIKYDYICILRPDILFYDYINYDELDLNKINISWFERKNELLNHEDAIIDHIAISSEELIKTYSETFLNISSLYLKQKKPFIPEILLGAHLKQNNLQTNMLSTIHTVYKPKGTK
jgi:hypothetical protein